VINYNIAMLKRSRKENSDLGLGNVITEESRQRMVNKDGSFNVAKKGINYFTSMNLYHDLLSMTWGKFILTASFIYFLMNLIFAAAYMTFGSDALLGTNTSGFWGELLRAFFFSVQTASTIGYGNITPVSMGTNLLVTLESFISLLGLALFTGLVFSRFSRPTANILFSDNAVIGPYKDITGFMFRIVNARKNQILELSAQVHFSYITNEGGKRQRRFHKLELERDLIPFFPLSWTIVHPIDKNSPLSGKTNSDLLGSEAEFMILLSGMDDTFHQTVIRRSSYKAEEIVFNAKFVRIYETVDIEGPITIDIDRLNQYEVFE